MMVSAPKISSNGTLDAAQVPPIKPPMSPGLIVLMLATLMGIQPVTTDLYLPALPALREGFAATMPQAQLTLSALLLAFGLSQLIWGPLSDRYGRRPILLWALMAYTLAAIANTLVSSMSELIAWRTVQGAAMGGVVMCARAIVRDLYLPADGARVMSKGLSGLGVLACLCPPLGGLLSELFGWRAALMALALFGVCALSLVALRFQETLTRPNPMALHPATWARTWRSILGNPTFLAFSALSVATYGGLITFLAASSFVFITVFGFSKTQYGLVLFFAALCYIAGTFVCRRLLRQYGVRQSVAIAALVSLAGGTLMAVLAWAGIDSAWAILLPHALFMLGHGVHQPCGQSGAVGPFPHAAGAASALNGFFITVAAFAMGSWLGTHLDGTVMPLVQGMFGWSVALAVTAWTAVMKYGDPSLPATRA